MSGNTSEFEQILNRSYELAVKFQHEYVSQEHLLIAILQTPNCQQLMTRMNVDHEKLAETIQDYLSNSDYHARVPDTHYQPKYTNTLLTTIKQAKAQSLFLGKNMIDGVDLIIAMFNTEHSHAVYFLNQAGVTKQSLVGMLSENSNSNQDMSAQDALLILSQYAVNLNSKAQKNQLDPLIGRQKEVYEITQTLARKTKNNPLLVGAPGVGKTQIVEGLAQLIVQKTTPKILWNKEIWSLDINNLVAGTKFRGDFEDRMKNLIAAVKCLPQVILFIDEIHMIMGAGSGGGQSSMDVANILKPVLGRGEIRTIGSTTEDEFRKHFEKDRALLRRFQRQDVLEPNVADAKQILQGITKTLAAYHQVSYDTGVSDAAVELSVKYVQHKHLPDKAIDLLDAAGAAVKIDTARDIKCVTIQDLQAQVSKIARVDLSVVNQTETDKVKHLMQFVEDQLFGQNKAVNQVVESVWLSISGLREHNKTMASFLFTGASGVGKTELAKLLAQGLGYAFVRFDMSEFQEKHALARLIGSPPGYVGYSDGQAGSGALINALEQTPQCVLLIDEVEKAHPDIANIFLQGMDQGQITSSNQKSVSMKNVILIFTSNLGAAAMSKPPLGFARDQRQGEDVAAVNQFFAPEFRNRLDHIVAFDNLTPQVMKHVLKKYITHLNHLCEAKHVKVVVNPDAKDWLIEHGFDTVMGARPLSRCIDTHIKKPMAKEMLFGKLQQGGTVMVSVDQDDDQKLKLTYLMLTESQNPRHLINQEVENLHS